MCGVVCVCGGVSRSAEAGGVRTHPLRGSMVNSGALRKEWSLAGRAAPRGQQGESGSLETTCPAVPDRRPWREVGVLGDSVGRGSYRAAPKLAVFTPHLCRAPHKKAVFDISRNGAATFNCQMEASCGEGVRMGVTACGCSADWMARPAPSLTRTDTGRGHTIGPGIPGGWL